MKQKSPYLSLENNVPLFSEKIRYCCQVMQSTFSVIRKIQPETPKPTNTEPQCLSHLQNYAWQPIHYPFLNVVAVPVHSMQTNLKESGRYSYCLGPQMRPSDSTYLPVTSILCLISGLHLESWWVLLWDIFSFWSFSGIQCVFFKKIGP